MFNKSALLLFAVVALLCSAPADAGQIPIKTILCPTHTDERLLCRRRVN